MSDCRNEAPSLACVTNADGSRVSVFAHHVYAADGSKHAVYYTDENDATVDVTAAGVSVTPGQCPVYAPDVEWEQLCDKQADGTVVRFMCQVVTSFDASGAVIVPAVATNYELDKVTPYTPVGTVSECEADCPVEAPLGLITDTSAL